MSRQYIKKKRTFDYHPAIHHVLKFMFDKMFEKGFTYTSMATKSGVSRDQLHYQAQSGSMKIPDLEAVLNVLGYTLDIKEIKHEEILHDRHVVYAPDGVFKL